MPLFFEPERAVCAGVWVRCKGRRCQKEFEIKINEVRLSELSENERNKTDVK